MSDTKVSALPSHTSLDGSEILLLVHGGADKQTGIDDICARAAARVPYVSEDRILYALPTDDTQIDLTTDFTGIHSALNGVFLFDQCEFLLDIDVIARANDVGGTITRAPRSVWTFRGMISRSVANDAPDQTIYGSQSLIAQDAGAAAWSWAIAYDAVNGSLYITAVGDAGFATDWYARIRTSVFS